MPDYNLLVPFLWRTMMNTICINFKKVIGNKYNIAAFYTCKML